MLLLTTIPSNYVVKISQIFFFQVVIDPWMTFLSTCSPLAVTLQQKLVKQAFAPCEFYLGALRVNWKAFKRTLIDAISTGCIYRHACELHLPLTKKMPPTVSVWQKTVRLTFQILLHHRAQLTLFTHQSFGTVGFRRYWEDRFSVYIRLVQHILRLQIEPRPIREAATTTVWLQGS